MKKILGNIWKTYIGIRVTNSWEKKMDFAKSNKGVCGISGALINILMVRGWLKKKKTMRIFLLFLFCWGRTRFIIWNERQKFRETIRKITHTYTLRQLRSEKKNLSFRSINYFFILLFSILFYHSIIYFKLTITLWRYNQNPPPSSSFFLVQMTIHLKSYR